MQLLRAERLRATRTRYFPSQIFSKVDKEVYLNLPVCRKSFFPIAPHSPFGSDDGIKPIRAYAGND